MDNGWSTEERRSSVRAGTRAQMRERLREMSRGERRRRRSLVWFGGLVLVAGGGVGGRMGEVRGRKLGRGGVYRALSNWASVDIVVGCDRVGGGVL